MSTAIYQLPETNSLNLDYLCARLILNSLNTVRGRQFHNKNVKPKVAQLLGINLRTLFTKITQYGIKYEYHKHIYYIDNTNPILEIINNSNYGRKFKN